MKEVIALVKQISDIRPAEVQTNGDAWVRAHTIPEGKIDYIHVLLLLWGYGYAVYGQQQKMQIVEVERVVFLSLVLDGPVLD